MILLQEPSDPLGIETQQNLNTLDWWGAPGPCNNIKLIRTDTTLDLSQKAEKASRFATSLNSGNVGLETNSITHTLLFNILSYLI
ncbi:hypothetical protein ACOSQ4_031884 [Xanthoceras sorbifolium]